MHPAPSVIVFTVLSGAGFGLLMFLGLGVVQLSGWPAFALWGLGYGLAVVGLLASTFHLGNPQRALLAFTQWRTSWLSREAWGAVVALLMLAPVALSDWLGLGWSRWPGLIGALAAAATVFATSMIYAQLKTVPRWNHWSTPVTFALFALAGGAVLAGQGGLAAVLLLVLGGALVVGWHFGDGRFTARGHDLASATGLARASVFEAPHTGDNYLLREMMFVVGRKHVAKLRGIAVLCAALLPAALLMVAPPVWPVFGVAMVIHLIGAAAARWLFFAQAEHVVGLYYGKR